MIQLTRLSLLLFISILILPTDNILAQERSFKIGANRTIFFGKSEKDASGKNLETFVQDYGFTAALMTEIETNDNSGVRFEMTYARKNFTWNYSGQSFQIFDTEGGNKVYAKGQKTTTLKTKLYYFELPVMFYQRFEGFEIAGGVNLGLLVGANAKGTMTFDGTTERGTKIPVYTSDLVYKYNNDKITTVELSGKTFTENGETIKIPKTMGAYYETRTKVSSPFNRYNVGLNGDVAYWFGDRMALRLRASYNFLDLTSNKNTYKRQALNDDRTPMARKGYENLFNYQLTLDFKL